MACCWTPHGFAPGVRPAKTTNGSCRLQRRSPQPPQAIAGLFGSEKERKQAEKQVETIEALRNAIEGTQRGITTSKEKKKEILTAVDALAELGAGTVTTVENLSGRWKLLWTTEKETLFLLKNAKWFGTQAGNVYQIINLSEGFLQNVITFPPDGAFVVDSSISVVSEQRTEFKFGAASLRLPGDTTLPLPSYGKGWFDTVYLDSNIRVATDIRGDTLIVCRDGLPTRF